MPCMICTSCCFACGDCPDDGLLLSLCFEEVSRVCLCSSAVALRPAPPLDGIIGPKRDQLSSHPILASKCLFLKLESALQMLVVNSNWRFVLLARLFRTALLRTQHMSCRATSSRSLAETQSPHLKSKKLIKFCSHPNVRSSCRQSLCSWWVLYLYSSSVPLSLL